MSHTVCLGSEVLYYPEGGGVLWQNLNWALGFRQIGCRVIWLEILPPGHQLKQVRKLTEALKTRLAPYQLDNAVALTSWDGSSLPAEIIEGSIDLATAAAEADLLFNIHFGADNVNTQFRRCALLDTDPGLRQMWVSAGKRKLAQHDVYFTIGETVGKSGALFPDLGLAWIYTPPCVATEYWPQCSSPANAPFTSIVHWWASADLTPGQPEDKRAGFIPFLDLPEKTGHPLELALDLDDGDPERERLRQHGWRVRNAYAVASTPWDYQDYIQNSRGEFSCCKPAYAHLQTAWVSDRSLCYLASGKPVVVQHTGPSSYLPEREGMFRFTTMDEAISAFDEITADYERHCKAARRLAEDHFDSKKVAAALLAKAL